VHSSQLGNLMPTFTFWRGTKADTNILIDMAYLLIVDS
jgi:hypothetical protein